MAKVTPTLKRGGPGIKSQAFSGDCGVLKNTATTQVALDLSGTGSTVYLFCPRTACTLQSCQITYTEATSANAGVAITIGKPGDADYYFTGTSATSQSANTETELTLLQTDVAAGDFVSVTNAGGKTGTGEFIITVEYTVDDENND